MMLRQEDIAKRLIRKNIKPSELPKVSIIMPVRNEASYVNRSLRAVCEQDYPLERLQVLVVDGMSDDGTRELITDFIRHQQTQMFHVLDNPDRIFSSGFNSGFSASDGDVIVMLGGHTEIAKDYVTRCVESLMSCRFACVGGPIETVGETFTSTAIAFAMSSRFGVGGVGFRTNCERACEVDTVAFGAYWRSVIEECGPIDEEMVRNQDDEFNYRLRQFGYKILLSPRIRCRYYGRNSIKSLALQYFRYGYWKIRVMQKHPKQMRPRQFVPGLFVAVLLVSLAASPFSGNAQILLASTASFYTAANLFASLIVGSKQDIKLLPLLPVVFAVLHLSYGCGFITGLFRFLNCWGDRANGTPRFETRLQALQDA
jgi:cellulose synthase/poly-beta-1,6-N-acetylglucosamine synthase-like glycosyltransferase